MEILGHQRGTAQALLGPLKDLPIKLRWGSAQVTGAINGNVRLLNGLQQLQAFRAANVPTPDFTASLAEAEEWARAGHIVLGRSLWHTQGKDIVLPGNSKWRTRDYWVKYWRQASSEWRFHILYGRSIGRGEKHYTGAINGRKLRKGQPGVTIRSRRLGWTIDHTNEPPEICRETAKAAAKAVGYELGAVDLLFGANDLGQPVVKVLEINSRPAIRDQYTIGQYTKYLEKWFKSVKWKAQWTGAPNGNR